MLRRLNDYGMLIVLLLLCALFSVLTIREKILLFNLHFKVPMEETGWIPVRNVQHHEVKRVLSNAFGFGGNDSSLLFCKCELS